MKSVYFRNFCATAVTVLICILIIALTFVGFGRSYVLTQYSDRMMTEAREVSRAASAISELDSYDGWTMKMTISAISSSTGNDILLTDAEGCIVACSEKLPTCGHIGMYVPIDFAGNIGGYSTFSDLDGLYPSERIVVSVPVMLDNNAAGYVIVSNPPENVTSSWGTFLLITAIISFAVFFTALIGAYIYSKRMARPLDEMAAASRKFARGDFSVRVKQVEDESWEMGVLIDSFNKMADSLSSAEARRSEFIGNISHELRTPMTTIAGFADGILDGTIPPEDERKYLISIRDETRRLSRLVRDMLDVSQAKAHSSDPSRRSQFDLTELTLQTLLSFEGRATKKELDVDPQLPDNSVMVFADKDAITRVIYNLLDNAVKFAAHGTCITVRLYKDGGKAFVSVRDCGETIPPDDLPYIFDRFHKSDRSRSVDKDGVGLGLYLVKAIINSHDEDIAVKSADGVTEFVFTLPLAEDI